jgi:hypothetical protein
LAAVSPRAELGARQAHPVSGNGIGPGEGFPGSCALPVLSSPHPPGEQLPPRSPDPSAAVAYAVQPRFLLTFRQQPQLRLLSLLTARWQTAYLGLCHNPHCSLQRFVVISHVIAGPAGTRRSRPPGTGWSSAAGRRRAGRSIPIPERTVTTIPARALREGSKHITWSRRRPLVRSDVELRPRTTHGSLGPRGRAAGGSSRAGVGPQLPRPAHGP